MDKRISVSVVIPVYNNEKYIQRCLDSIVNQTVKDYKVIIVDDGSSDNSLAICKKYAQDYDNLECYSIKTAGVSNARNYGIERVDTEYIMFMDSDDVVSEHFVEIMLKTIIDAKCSIAECRYRRIGETDKYDFDNISEKYTKLSKKDAILKLTLNENTHYVWNKIFKTSVFEGVRFISNRYYEDIAIMYRLFENAEQIAYVEAELYGYCINPSSITSTHDDKKREDILLCWMEQYEYFKDRYPELEERCLDRIAHYYINAFDNTKEYNESLKHINGKITSYYKKIMKSNVKSKDKLKIKLAKNLPRIYVAKNRR